MKYSTLNTQISLTTDFAEALRAAGYDVYWQQTNDTDAHTSEHDTPLATVTLIKEIPANPALIVRLKSDNAGEEEIVVPAFTLYLPDQPQRGAHMGIGHVEWTWTREMWVEGFAYDDFQQKDLADLVSDWLNRPGTAASTREFTIRDHVGNPASPPVLGSMRVERAAVERFEFAGVPEAMRYYVKAVALLSYEE